MENENTLRGADPAILPEFRNLGIGTIVLKGLMTTAAKSNRVFTFQVLKTNRAIKLYDRLKCRIVADNGSHFIMEWQNK